MEQIRQKRRIRWGEPDKNRNGRNKGERGVRVRRRNTFRIQYQSQLAKELSERRTRVDIPALNAVDQTKKPYRRQKGLPHEGSKGGRQKFRVGEGRGEEETFCVWTAVSRSLLT